MNQEANNSLLASSTPVEPSNSGNDSSAQANENTSPILSSPDIVDNASNSSGSDVSASTNLNPKTETPQTTPPEIIKGSEIAPITSNTENSTSNSPSSEVTDKSASNSSSNLPTNQETISSTTTTIPSEGIDSETAPISSNTENSTSNSLSSEATDKSASNSSSDLSTNQEKDLKTGENAPSTTVETNNEKSSQTGSTTESSKPDSALTNSSDGSSSPESLTDKKTSSSSEIKTDQSVPTFELEESEGSPTTNTSVINKITESRKDTEETIAISAQSKVDSNKSATANLSKELDKNQLVDEKPLKESPDKSADSGKQLPNAPANSQESSDKAASPQNILQILPNLPEKNTINKVEPEDSNSHLTEQNPAQNLKEILPILKNSPIDSANIDQGIIKKILKFNKEVQKSQSQLSKNLPLALDSDKISNVKLIAKDKQNQNEYESWKTSPDFDRIAVEKSEMALTTPDSSTQNSGISSKSDSDNSNQEGQFNIENRDKLFSEREEAGAIISDNHKLSNTNVLSKNNSKIKLFISLLIIIIGSAIGWFI
ncbi:MAG: leucine-rich repeat domain-containing protein, partial [Lactococcus lactis]|nr:leucine-rich repeat domain-containing protein [Lactococcus lactis]